MLGLILAGGRGTRLSIVNGNGSKALVSVGNKPHLIHQIQLLRDAGCFRIKVVAARENARDVQAVIDRAGLSQVFVIIQENPLGPVDAIYAGIRDESSLDSVHVLMSDTYVSEELKVVPGKEVTVGCAPAPKARSFAYWDRDHWKDGEVKEKHPVTIGAYFFPDIGAAVGASYQALHDRGVATEVNMSALLNILRCKRVTYDTWLDLGDIEALQRARTAGFMSREHHSVRQPSPGMMTKDGTSAKEYAWMRARNVSPAPHTSVLVPKVWQRNHGYTMEYIDWPTLSELWLYREAVPQSWAWILKTVLRELNYGLWFPLHKVPSDLWFPRKAVTRLTQLDRDTTEARALLVTKSNILPYELEAVTGHGDLNFNNIFYSTNTGAIKLIDPRGDKAVPLLYELGKLRASYHGGFSAITHGLSLPNRAAEIKAMDVELGDKYTQDQLNFAEACILLAATPLHKESESDALYERGMELLNGVAR